MGVLILTLDDLWRLSRLLPALASGLITCALAFLLARKTGKPVYRAFGWLVLSFLTYGTTDLLTREFWTKEGWDHLSTKLAGAADILALAWMVRTLGFFTSALLERPLKPTVRWGIALPLVAALATGGLLFTPGIVWTEAAFGAVGLGYLAVVLLATLVCGTGLLIHDHSLSDRPFRLWAWGLGGLILAFVPLWTLEALRVVQWGGFAWFFLGFNLLGLATMVGLHFQPASRTKGALFDPQDVGRCARRFGWTEREAEVAALHARGLSSTQIAQRLFIAPKTVRNHVANLYQKTGIHQRMALMELLAKG